MKRRVLALLGLLLLGAVGVGATWAPDRSADALAPRWAPPPSTFADIAGLKVHLRDEGPRDDPHPIVLLHGTSASLHTWEGWVRALVPAHRVITLDLPGFGLTGPFLEGDYAMAHYVAFVAAALDALSVRSCVLGGSSFGGNIAWETALAYPDRVERLILVDAAGYERKSTSVPIGFKLARLPVLKYALEYILPRSVIESSLRSVYGDPTKVTPELVDRYYELTLRAGNRRAVGRRLLDAPPGEHAARIPELKVPTLILWGALDRLIVPADGEHFERDIAGSQRVVFPGLGHVPHEEDPASSVVPVLAFLSKAL